MKTYKPSFRGDPLIRREFERVQQASLRADPLAELEVLYAEPDKLRAGMVVYADGVTWNPGSGEGIYRRNVANSAWVHLG